MSDRREKESDETMDLEAEERIAIMVFDGKISEADAREYAQLDYMERMAKGGGK